MEDIKTTSQNVMNPQCQFYVLRKKRLCRMTVRPGRYYCGEHEPHPKTEAGQSDERIPCPNDPKHTCYVSKLEKHLAICNARPVEQPPYIQHNINVPETTEPRPRKPLSEISKDIVLQVIEKVNCLYDKHVKENMSAAPERPIHRTVLPEFSEGDRAESSRRHLRQASRLLWLVEEAGLVRDHTCYVELGAGKGHLSYYACTAWCAAGSSALLVDRASLRHKRDNKLRRRTHARIRADLAHLALRHVPLVQQARAVVGLAKHLCGVATDYALRCVAAARAGGLVLATCCHHRCEPHAYVASRHLRELGVSGDELNVLLGIVSWATCGDGRSRQQRARAPSDQRAGDCAAHEPTTPLAAPAPAHANPSTESNTHGVSARQAPRDSPHVACPELALAREYRERAGRRAKALLDWGRVLYLREQGFDATLWHFVSTSVSLENVCIVATKRAELED